VLDYRTWQISFYSDAATVLLITAGVTYAQQNCTGDGSGPYGSLPNEDEFNQAVQALPPAAFPTPRVQPPLPSNAYLDNLPAVSQQGTTATPALLAVAKHNRSATDWHLIPQHGYRMARISGSPRCLEIR
jgi:hypothetical protein